MKYIVFPAEKLDEVSKELLEELHLSPRYSVDGTEVIMKVINYEKLFPSVQTLPLTDSVIDGEEQEIIYPYPVYNGEPLRNLLKSSIWSESESTVLESPSILSDNNSTQSKSKKSTKTNVL